MGDKYFKLDSAVRFRKEEWGVFCVHIVSNKSMLIHPSEAVILSLCSGAIDENEIIETISYIFDVSVAMAEKTFNGIVDKFGDYLLRSDSPSCNGITLNPTQFVYQPKQASNDEIQTYSGPLSIVLSLTLQCNYKCVYCYKGGCLPKKDELTTSEFISIIEQAKELGVFRSFVTGGEPALRSDFAKIIRVIISNGLYPYVSTNGSLISLDLARELIDGGLKTIQISLDSFDEKIQDKMAGYQDSWQLTLKGINNSKTAGLEVRTKCVVTTFNMNTLESYIDQAFNNGIDYVGFSIFFPGVEGRGGFELVPSMQELKNLHEMSKAKRKEYEGRMEVEEIVPMRRWSRLSEELCGAMVTALAISSTGDIIACDLLEQDQEMWAGNIRHNSLKDIWLSSKAQDIRNLRHAQIKEPCISCKQLSLCRTGCFNYSKVCYGDLFSTDPRCPKAKPLPFLINDMG